MPRARAVEPAVEESEEDRRKRLLRKAYGHASQDLREKYRRDFEMFYAARAQEAGVQWSPRASAEEKATQQFEELLEQFPFLAERAAVDPRVRERWAEADLAHAEPDPSDVEG